MAVGKTMHRQNYFGEAAQKGKGGEVFYYRKEACSREIREERHPQGTVHH